MPIKNGMQQCDWINNYWEETSHKWKVETNAMTSASGVSGNDAHGIKLFIDATVLATCEGSGYGAVVIGEDGDIKGAMEMVDSTSYTPLAVKIQSIMHGIRLIQPHADSRGMSLFRLS